VLIRPNEQVLPVPGRFGLYWRYLFRALNPETVGDFERAAAEALSVPYTAATLSGSMALTLILQALRLEPGSRVVLPVFTYFGLPGILERAGLVPVFADVDPVAARLRADDMAFSSARVALAPQLFGVLTDTAVIRRALGEGGTVIADCAHAALVGVDRGVTAPAFGDVAFLSFDQTKILDTMRGGMVLAPDERLIDRLKEVLSPLPAQPVSRALRTALLYEAEALIRGTICYSLFGRLLASPAIMDWVRRQYRRLNLRPKQGYFRLSPLQAAMGLVRLRQASSRNALRVAHVKLYLDRLRDKVSDLSARRYLDEAAQAFINAAPYPSTLVLNVRRPAEAQRLARRLGFEVLAGSRVAEFFGAGGARHYPGAAHLHAHAIKLPIMERVNEYRFRFFVERFTDWLADELAPYSA